MMTNNFGIYIHIPFCKKKCSYCDFYSVCGTGLEESYAIAVGKHISMLSPSFCGRICNSIFIGGGTPSVLSAEQTEYIAAALNKCFDFSDDTEFSVEANPATLDREKLYAMRKCGINRISIGLQSANNSELSSISRIHSFEDFLNTYRLVREYFDNVNVDLMYGLPGQTESSFCDSVKRLAELRPEHISMYGLRVEENTPLGRNIHSYTLPSEDVFSNMYLDGSAILSSYGYGKYEISNFALDGYECRHNLRYWNRSEYLGIGPAAHSFLNGERYAYAKNVEEYIMAIENGKEPMHTEICKLSKEDELSEEIMLSLRLSKGLDLAQIKHSFGIDILSLKKDLIMYLISKKYAVLNGNNLSLTDKGMLVSNYIISELT